ncbi:hypothetical protein NPIL_269281 [Nephila pilipes]|uniref:Uncharacterized protein n=1 Tax=Nephila pilipes TaxID=299642 RepID=A0A8X6U7C1_NEPPI|nr:hypothetical protein NPIL_269281 [Nephila pilipes]
MINALSSVLMGHIRSGILKYLSRTIRHTWIGIPNFYNILKQHLVGCFVPISYGICPENYQSTDYEKQSFAKMNASVTRFAPKQMKLTNHSTIRTTNQHCRTMMSDRKRYIKHKNQL